MSWKGESRRHSLARKGIKTNIDQNRRFDVSTFVAKGDLLITDEVIQATLQEIIDEWDDYTWDGVELKIYNKGKLVATITDREIIEHFALTEMGTGGKIKKIKYIGEGRSMHGYLDRSWDEYLFEEQDGTNIEVYIYCEPDWDMLREVAEDEGIKEQDWDEFVRKEENEFYKEGNGEVHVIWAGALDFTGTENEFADRYPELNEHLNLGTECTQCKAREIRYKGHLITRLFPSGYYEYYSDNEKRFIKSDELDMIKGRIDKELS